MLEPGLAGELSETVSVENSVPRGEVRVYSTPSMLSLLERACHATVAPGLQPGEHTVGSRVELRHLAPSLEGMEVTARCLLEVVDGRRLVFRVEVFDPFEKVGEASHERYVIDVGRYAERLRRKAAAGSG